MARFTSRMLGNDDAPQWSALWHRVGGPLGLHWRWCEFAATNVGEPARLGIFSSDGRLVAGIPFVQRRRRMRTEWHHPVPASFAGILAAEDLVNNESSLREIFEAATTLINERVARAELVLPSHAPDARGLLWNRWTAQPHYNYVSTIRQVGDLARQAENAARRQAAKAEAEGLVFEKGDHLQEEIFALWARTRERQNLPRYVDVGCYKALLANSAAEDAEITGFAAAIRNPASGRIIAAAIIGQDRQRAYYLLGASDNDQETTGAPTLLQFQLTDDLFKKRGEFHYDWVGANTPHIAQFKKKFRPRLEMYLRCAYRQGMARLIP
ncbi:GNAT family N-acetyltransferase [Candidatus Sumerlaeota bacterium]|nr:GNAT family N-acetyltransferase [Candidatus Sumerlaeota bacterium]